MTYQHDDELEGWEKRKAYLKETKITMITLIDKEIGSCEDNIERYKMDKRNWEYRHKRPTKEDWKEWMKGWNTKHDSQD